jgi:uncharacterized tellurite resistance protein B-like protein
MLRTIQEFFDTRIKPGTGGAAGAGERSVQLATAALLIEVSRADQQIKDEERRVVTDAVGRLFNLLPKDTEELIRLAEDEAASAVSMFQFTHLVDKAFSPEQKVRVVELLWHVAYADAEKDRHEEHLVRRIADLLRVSHKDFIEAKLRARDGSAPSTP